MAYDKGKIFEKAKELIVEHNLFFIEDIVALLPISKPTFYEYYPIDSNEINEIKELLEKNKVDVKVSLRKKWQDSDNATLQVSLYKIIGSTDERKALSNIVDKEDNKEERKDISKLFEDIENEDD